MGTKVVFEADHKRSFMGSALTNKLFPGFSGCRPCVEFLNNNTVMLISDLGSV